MKILVTGTAGFIGFFVATRLLEDNHEVVGIDCVNDYYDPRLKYARLREAGINPDLIDYDKYVLSAKYPKYRFIKLDLEDESALMRLFEKENFDKVCHLAARVGVRYSISNPKLYVNSNIVGFANLLEGCRCHGVKHLIYASSSSVYGANEKTPYSEDDRVDNPVSLYAVTKRTNELMADVYAKLHGISATGLRFFTVYGPWGRPDMAPFLFAKAILTGKPIKVFNNGNLSRDFTYINDIVEGLTRIINHHPKSPGNQIYNIGFSHPVSLMEFIEVLEEIIGEKAKKEFLPMQPGDVYQTYADISKLNRDFGYKPSTSLKEGVTQFIQWYLSSKNLLR
ncbi:MAG: NAD-dependent epimerase/dehydratase family protein [Candidatus Omnitrophota bacterium]|jgi:UDP-glucuronate 4-epimerase